MHTRGGGPEHHEQAEPSGLYSKSPINDTANNSFLNQQPPLSYQSQMGSKNATGTSGINMGGIIATYNNINNVIGDSTKNSTLLYGQGNAMADMRNIDE